VSNPFLFIFIENVFIINFVCGIFKVLNVRQLTCAQLFVGIMLQIFAKITRKLVFAVLETRVNSCTIGPIISLVGSSRER